MFRRISTSIVLLALTACSLSAVTAPKSWTAVVGLTSPGVATVGKISMTSSSKFEVQWNLPGEAINHFEITASDGKSKVLLNAKGTEQTATLTMLKADTKYTVTLKGCLEAKCEKFLTSDKAAEGKTSAEYWQVQGTGNSFTTATRIVEDGNTKPYTVVYGDWAGKDLTGKVQLYYDPGRREEKGVKLATPNGANLFSFNGVTGFGLISYCLPQPPAPGQPQTQPLKTNCEGSSSAAKIATFQVIPLTNGVMRVFFEGEGTDQKTRVMSIDSQDGFVGRDFNSGSATVCATAADYAKGGGCEPTVVIGVDGDPVMANAKVQAARQFKIGYPTLQDGRWDGATGTFMFVTIDLPQTCAKQMMTAGYAVWNGKEWKLQYGSNGCPKYFGAVQAPMPLHIGGVRYKMYFNNTTAMQGQPSPNALENKPMKVIYGDGVLTGDAKVVDFEDWDTLEQAHDVNYLWPDGTLLSTAEKSHLDDYVIFYPDPKNPDWQIMYSNMSLSAIGPGSAGVAGGNLPPFIGGLVLINP